MRVAAARFTPSYQMVQGAGIVSISSVRRFYSENGAYLLGRMLFVSSCGYVRNHLISRKLGVKKIFIGPRASLRGLSSVHMGEGFCAGEGLRLEAITTCNNQVFTPRITIGNHVSVGNLVHIAATHLITIADNVLLGSKVIITDHNHGQYSREHTSPLIAPALRPLDHDRRVVIGRNAWLGDGVVVTPDSCIGEGAVIGANSVICGNIPPFAIAAGVPAEILKTFNFKALPAI